MVNMDKSKVVVLKCDTYDYEPVYDTVEKGINLLGGIANFVKEGEKILIKPNVLIGADPEKCISTHPSVFRAVGVLLKKAKAAVYYGDSSAFGECAVNMERASLKQVADELEIIMADFDKGKVVNHSTALLNKMFVIANGVLASDGLVSLSKLKTHELTRFTGAVKNQFGCVPGLRKGQFHARLPSPFDFATMLVDLNTLVKPRLYIMDGIMAMEGNGPRNGQPKKLGIILFSTDPVALDAIACKIIDLDPEYVPTSKPGERASLGTYHYKNIEVIGEDIDSLVDKDFDVVRKPPVEVPGGIIRKFINKQISPKPFIDKKKCTNCGTCVRHCPVEPGALDWHTGDNDKPPTYKYDRCIRCFCCQELCPEGAISVRETIFSRILKR